MSCKRNKRFASCFTCRRVIREEDFSEHLFFGTVKCSLCNAVFRDCQSFWVYSVNYSLGYVMCKHEFHYMKDPLMHMSDILGNRIPYGFDKKNVKTINILMEKLSTLENRTPWSEAISFFKNVTSQHKGKPWRKFIQYHREFLIRMQNVKREADANHMLNDQSSNQACSGMESISNPSVLTDSQTFMSNWNLYDNEGCGGNSWKSSSHSESNYANDTLFLNFDIRGLEENVEILNKYEIHDIWKENVEICKTNALENDTHCSIKYVSLPPDDFYYISAKPIEECPHCYEVLCPSQCTLNTQTYLMTIICAGCDLTIYITTAADVKIVAGDDMADRNERPKGLKKVVKPKTKRKVGRPKKGKSYKRKHYFFKV